MPYTNAQATPRSDIFALMMQANSDFNKMFIADKIFPVKTENVKRGIYMRANLANAQLLNADAQPRESGAAYQRVNREYDTDQYDCQEYGLEAVVDVGADLLHEQMIPNIRSHVRRAANPERATKSQLDRAASERRGRIVRPARAASDGRQPSVPRRSGTRPCSTRATARPSRRRCSTSCTRCRGHR